MRMLLVVAFVVPTVVWSQSQSVSFKDPAGDDVGPGTYTYPTDAMYKKGSYDLTALTIEQSGGQATITLEFAAPLEDPLKTGVGFALQSAVLFIDPGSGTKHREGLPGMNVVFAEGHEWARAVFISPQSEARVRKELAAKASQLAKDVIVPLRVSATGRRITATVPASALGAEFARYRYQVVVGRYEAFALASDVLWGRVNEEPGPHRFGGGNDAMCDPHALDVLAGRAEGEESEKRGQFEQLRYECGDDGSVNKPATLKLVGPKK